MTDRDLQLHDVPRVARVTELYGKRYAWVRNNDGTHSIVCLERVIDTARAAIDLLPHIGGNCQRGAHDACLFGALTCPCRCHDLDRIGVRS